MTASIAGSVLRPLSILEAFRPHQGYRKLERKRKEIRIAELSPKAFREKTKRQHVSCYIRTASLEDISGSLEPYTALSYTWGDPTKRVPIHLDNRLIQVTENLSEALKHFEQNHLALRIWIDAICINQTDEIEKSQQVQMMAEIFERASEVFVWLGPSEDGSKEALEVLRQIGNEALQLHGQYQHMNRHADNIDDKKAVGSNTFDTIRRKWFPDGVPSFDLGLTQKVLQRSWFRRVWVLQEAALNENVTFYCGKQSISKHVLWAGARTIIALTNEISAHSRASITDLPVWQTLAGTNFISRRTLHFVTSGEKKFPLGTLLTDITTNLGEWAYEATDPRDRIFAILGFSSDSTALNVRPDYEKTCKDVYTEVAEAILTQASNLDILYAVSGPKNMKAMPSWVPDWSVPVQSTFGLRQLRRYSASGPLSRSFPAFRSDKFGNRLLILSGYRFDTVDIIMQWQWDPRWDVRFDLDSPVLGFIQCLQNFGQSQKIAYHSEEEKNEALWRTPIADCDSVFSVVQGSRPPASLRMKESFEAFIGITRGDSKCRETVCKPYIHVMKLESARRRVFLSSRGYYGLGQEMLRVGDTICLFPGGDSPFLIREAGLGYCELIGETYVHGIMHGEYLGTNPQIEQFILC